MPKNTTQLYIPARRTRWLEWQAEDDESEVSFRAKVRADLTFGEVDALQFDAKEAKTADVHEMLAPYVVEWNVGTINVKGEPEAVPAPAVAGGEMFRAVPNEFFWWLFREIKFGSVKQPDPKSSAPAEATVAP